MANPEFFRPGIETTSTMEGSFTQVTKLKGLPPEILERLPKGYVLKQYINNPELDKDLFGPDYAKLSIVDKARILKERQTAVRAIFADDLPELVVPSDFLVGQGVDDEQPHLFEVQPNVPKGVDVLREWYHVENILEKSPQTRQAILGQLKLFVENGRKLQHQQDQPALKGKVLDLEGANNLIVTPDGDLRLIDTNYLFSPDNVSPKGKKLYDSYFEYLNLIAAHVREIEEVINSA